jgi:hypothetical protein
VNREQLIGLIDVMVDVVTEAGGTAVAGDAMRATARRTGASVSVMSYVLTSAVADYRLTHSLRSGAVSLPGHVPDPNALTAAEKRVWEVLETQVTEGPLIDLNTSAGSDAFRALVRKVTSAARYS